MTYLGTEPTKQEIRMTRGDDAVTLTVTHSLATTAFDEAKLYVRNKVDGDIVFALTLTANASQWSFPSSSSAVITINTSDTDGKLVGHHRYDVELTPTATGSPTTVQNGVFVLEPDISNDGGGGALAGLLDEQLIEWTYDIFDMLTSVSYHATYIYVPSSATINWPDGSSGTYTTTAYDATNEEWSSFTATHTDSGKTVTQSAVTRNSNGQITTRPTMTVS